MDTSGMARERRWRTILVAAVVLAAGSAVPAQSAERAPAGAPLTIEVLGNRADLVSGGDALIDIGVPAGVDVSKLRVTLDGRDVSGAFAHRANGRVQGLVDGLRVGENEVVARVPGRAAVLTITNHPISGPVFSGPHLQPWRCAEGSLDEHCNRPATYRYLYLPTGGGGLQPYDPAAPPGDVATTTTDQGHVVPFIVREETGVIARDQYRVATLFDPSRPWEPWAPQPGYNGKLVINHGASCDTSYAMGSAPDVLNAEVLGRGFAVMSHALDNAGHNCNIVTQAESLVMTKEHVAETYGPIRYTIGSGCSGGALAQQQVANAYPGVYQGITPACSYPDAWTSAMQYVDYDGLLRYFQDPASWSPGTVWEPLQIAQVLGHPNPANPVTFTTVIPNSGKPSRSCPGVPAEEVYDAQTNPGGVRCTLHDYMRNVFGTDAATGFALRPVGNEGIMYGLRGLLAGTLLPQQFVDVNTKAGGVDVDYNAIRERVAPDALAVQRAYRSGANNTAQHLDQVAIIDMRGPDPGAFHDVYRTYALRERLVREHGHADNQVLWRGSVPILGDTTFTDEGIFAMDRWLAVVEADGRDVPLAQKIVEARATAGVEDRCTSGAGQDLPPQYCEVAVQRYATPRIAAGMPTTDDVMTCVLKPLRRADFPGVLFLDHQWEALQEAFPTGVCDWTKPDPNRVPTVPWLDYGGGPGGQPLGEPPTSRPLRA
jgi:hypothetical protein